MASLTDRALVFANDVSVNAVTEVGKELTGQTRRKWILVVAAFVLGAAVVAAVAAVRRLEAADRSGSAVDIESEGSGLPRPGETQWWHRWAGNAHAGLSTAWRVPARS